MIGWIKDHLRGARDFIEDKIDAVIDALSLVWRTTTGFFRHIGYGWGALMQAAQYVRDVFGFLGSHWYAIVKHLWEFLIPKAIRHAVDITLRWVTRKLGELLDVVTAGLAALRKWAVDGIHALQIILGAFRDWAAYRINVLRHWVNAYGNLVADLVLHPERLVAWILPHLLRPVLRFLLDRATVIGRFVLRRSVGVTLDTASVVEDVLAKIL